MKKILVIILAIGTLTACGRFGKKEKDGAGMRIVSLSKHLTEFIFALGKGHELVAVDLSSTYPDSAKQLPTVGYHRALNPEGIIAANPGLVVHSNDIGPDNVLPQITKAGLSVKSFGGANTIDSTRMLIRELGQFFHEEKMANSLVAKMDSDLQKAEAFLQSRAITDTPSVMIIHFGRAMNIYFVMSGRKGPGDKMIELAGGKVAGYDGKGARQLSAEAVAAADPDIIIATDYGYDQMGSMDKFISTVPGVALTKAGKNKRIIRFEEHDLVYFGPRTGENIIQLIQQIHPNGSNEK
ncbi:ABC transporter substrate-binding protein [Flavihumibacter rivuli]|uniref:heme/hemin ABC transporter substrate-binding protein n=1 Tax=Flavihumibacter rivuli TaxID=2838156 RepID=UPI001BDF28B3|nr:ABC transporter substrate-binding protein [Flavihumibacter rivuli]ULQ55941.1 ABC transporter substrate-binding protein [Flavihumibacter rivuli]